MPVFSGASIFGIDGLETINFPSCVRSEMRKGRVCVMQLCLTAFSINGWSDSTVLRAFSPQRRISLAAWQQKYRYILVDEFQDINQLQYDIVRLLAAPEDNLFIVGDDDQSIYGFRGSRPEIMLNFTKEYPKAERVLLDVNYRSRQGIVDTAARLISHNKMRFDKAVRAQNEQNDGVKIYSFQSKSKQAESIALLIKQYIALPDTKYSRTSTIFIPHQ